MLHALLTSALAMLFLAAPATQDESSNKKSDDSSDKKNNVDKKKDEGKKEKKLPPAKRRVGRPGDLTEQEEDRLDRILDAFIAHDIGLRHDPRTVKALQNMGPEAIPALIRALNKSAHMSDSCPVSMFHRKLTQLFLIVEDEEVLRLARSSITTGGRRTPYEGLLTQLRVATSQRQAYLARTQSQEGGRLRGSRNNDSRYSKDP